MGFPAVAAAGFTGAEFAINSTSANYQPLPAVNAAPLNGFSPGMTPLVVVHRDGWDAAEPRSRTWLPSEVDYTVHWIGSPDLGDYAPADVAGILRDVQRSHMVGQGWSDIAYNFAVDRFGGVWELRGWNVRSAAQGSSEGNGGSLAVVMLLGQHDAPPTDAAIDAVILLRRELLARGGNAPVWGHRDWVGTACPGNDLYAALDRVRADVLTPPPPPPPAPAEPPILPEPEPEPEEPAMTPVAPLVFLLLPDGVRLARSTFTGAVWHITCMDEWHALVTAVQQSGQAPVIVEVTDPAGVTRLKQQAGYVDPLPALAD